MPRNASGTYALPSGNPVSSGTLIDATWANNTLNDIANEMTDSLSRSGEGGMLAPFRLNDGVQATPGLAFTNEPSTGMYRAGTNEAWLVAGGTQVLQFTTNGAAARFAAGAVGTPSITALGDLNTGFWFPAADTLALSTNGVERLRVGSGGDFAFDTNVLFVDATNNRVGVGTITPAVALDVNGGLSIQSANNLTWGGAYGATTPAISGAAGFLAFYPNGSTSGEIARLTSTGLGIGTASPTEALELSRTTDPKIRFVDVGNLDAKIGIVGSTALGFEVSGSERMRLDSSGNFGIGTASPSAYGKFVVVGTGDICNLDTTSGATGIAFFENAVGRARIRTLNGSDGLAFLSGATERMRLNSTGALVLTGGTAAANGTGITFPATQSASTDPNTLDDYEEGTFTPTLVGTGSNPTVTYVEQLGSYTKIGNVVHFRVRLVVSAASGGSGDLRVGSLPFTAATIAPPGISNVQFTSSFVANPTVAGVVISTAQISLWTNVTGTSLAVSDLTGGSFNKFLNIAGTYFV